jgi:hypothetical protein
MSIHTNTIWLHQAHFDTRQIVRSVSHFVYEFVELVIVLGHRQSPILSSSFLDMDRSLFFRTNPFTNLMSQLRITSKIILDFYPVICLVR